MGVIICFRVVFILFDVGANIAIFRGLIKKSQSESINTNTYKTEIIRMKILRAEIEQNNAGSSY